MGGRAGLGCYLETRTTSTCQDGTVADTKAADRIKAYTLRENAHHHAIIAPAPPGG